MQDHPPQKHFNLSHARDWLQSENPKERLLGSKLLERLTDGSVFLLAEVPSDQALVALENQLPLILTSIRDLGQKLYFSDSAHLHFDIEEQILNLLMRALGNCLVMDYLQSEVALRNWIPDCLRILRATRSGELRASCLRALVNYSTRSVEQRRDVMAKLRWELQDLESDRLSPLARAYLRVLVFQI